MKNRLEITNNKSIKNFIWQEKNYDAVFAKEIAENFGCSEIIAEILASRISKEQAEKFIRASIKHNMTDPLSMQDMDKASEFIADAIIKDKKIAVFGDYDVDGATSSTLISNYLAMVGRKCRIYIPDRIEEGYGPNTNALEKLQEEGAELVITVDCGATSFEPLEAANKAGLDVIVLDHHQMTEEMPPAVAVVNPNRPDDKSEHKYLAAVGVSFMVLVAVNKILREKGFFEGKAAPDLMSLLDLVALGTVCDVVALTGLNRALVSQGLKVMQRRGNIGINALLADAKVAAEDRITPFHLGFMVGPRINAGGRVADAGLGARLLSCSNKEEAEQMATKLGIYNKERKALETLVLEEAALRVEQEGLADNPVIVLDGQGWHPGVIGIVASRIKDKYNRPVAVIGFDGDIGKASCRSIEGVDLGRAIASARESELLVTGGGHAMAAGFTIHKARLFEFKNYLEDLLVDEVLTAIEEQKLMIDRYLAVEAVNVNLVKDLEVIGPFGSKNHEPRFALTNCRVVNSRLIGENHVKAVLAENSAGMYGKNIEAIAWRSADTEIGQILLGKKHKISVAGNAKINVWQDQERVQFIIEDLKIEN